jgi:glycerate kinase
MEIDEKMVATMNHNSQILSANLDAVISKFVDSQSDEVDVHIPFIIMSAISTVITKLTLVMEEKNCDAIFGILKDLAPSEEELQEMKQERVEKADNVIPLSSRVH